MKYFVQGQKISLTRHNFIFKGGEASIYGKNKTVYKIFTNLQQLIPRAKINELKIIQDSNVIKPLNVILDQKDRYVGFTMPWIKKSIPLAKLFTNTFRNKNKITHTAVMDLVENIRATIDVIHAANCLMIDGNEFNYLVDNQSFTTPYFIDVNSYQTPSFPATVIMPSIRDLHSKTFSPLTDWFSFGIIACQIFIGIHPYKGRHPQYHRKDMGNNLMKNRMLDHISVFNQKVSLPSAARDFSTIPTNYRNWFIELFEHGQRTPPPNTMGPCNTVRAKIRMIVSTDYFDIKLIREYQGQILYHHVVNGREITKTDQKLYLDNLIEKDHPDDKVLFSLHKTKPVLVRIKNGLACFTAPDQTAVQAPEIEADQLMTINNSLFIRKKGRLTELVLKERPDHIIMVMVRTSWNIMVNSSEVFQGVIFQSILGQPYLMIPLPMGKKTTCINIHIPELEGYRILDARHDKQVCMLIGYQNNIYNRIILKFNQEYSRYTCRIEPDIEPFLNFVVLDNGVVVAIHAANTLEVFSNQDRNDQIKMIKDVTIDGSMQLCKDGIITKFFKDNQLFSIRMRK